MFNSQQNIRIIFILNTFLLMTLCSCGKDMLSVYTDYVTIENLASYYVETPDPNLDSPPFEQRLVIHWSIPNEIALSPETKLSFTVRFRNRKEVAKEILIQKRIGTYIFFLDAKTFCENRGILTYKVQLVNEACILEEWRHQLWAELIVFDE